MADETNKSEHYKHTDDEFRIAMFKALEQIFLHSQQNTEVISRIHARLEGAIAGNAAVAKVVDDNENRIMGEREIAAHKELISHLFEKSHQYVTIIVAGAFAAYFTTLGAVASRFSDIELRWSALLMTVSLAVFIMWEVLQMFYIGHHTFKGDYGVLTEQPKWMKRGWYVVMMLTLGTALPAIGLSLYVYLRGLGVGILLCP